MNDFIPAAKPIISDDERSAVDAVLASGMLAQGRQVALFEEEFSAKLVASRTCVAVNSGTSGLHLALLASGIGPGDEVIVPSFTFAATANSVALTGATPVFADIDPTTYCLSPQAAEAAITSRTRGVMPVHLYGHPAAMDEFVDICTRHRIMLFEDAAQAHGASLHGRPVGSFGDFAVFSLYPTKNMTSGEGGIVACADDKIARSIRLLRNQGMERQYENEIVGFNARMTDIHAAIGRVQLTKLRDWTQTRIWNAAFLTDNLEGVITPTVVAGAAHVYHQYTIRVPQDRDRMQQILHDEYGIGSGVYYPIPNHKLPSLTRFAPNLVLPQTEMLAAEVLSLPVHPSLSQADLDRIVSAVNTIAKAGA